MHTDENILNDTITEVLKFYLNCHSMYIHSNIYVSIKRQPLSRSGDCFFFLIVDKTIDFHQYLYNEGGNDNEYNCTLKNN